jgi:hypothetical protein
VAVERWAWCCEGVVRGAWNVLWHNYHKESVGVRKSISEVSNAETSLLDLG